MKGRICIAVAAMEVLAGCSVPSQQPVPDPQQRVLISGLPASAQLATQASGAQRSNPLPGRLTADSVTLPSVAVEYGQREKNASRQVPAIDSLEQSIRPKPEVLPVLAQAPAVATPASAQAKGRPLNAAQSSLSSLDEAIAIKRAEVRFAFALSQVGPKGRKELADLTPLAKKATSITLVGATDPAGDPRRNHVLALARAHAVAKVLTDAGVQPHLMLATACTQNCAVSTDHAANRRVDVEIVVREQALTAREIRPLLLASR